MTNGLVAEEGLGDEHRVREAQRRLLRDVGDAASPKRLPSPTAASISACVSPTTMPTSSMPAARMASRP